LKGETPRWTPPRTAPKGPDKPARRIATGTEAVPRDEGSSLPELALKGRYRPGAGPVRLAVSGLGSVGSLGRVDNTWKL
jgi:hypothetical protein